MEIFDDLAYKAPADGPRNTQWIFVTEKRRALAHQVKGKNS